MLPRPSLQEGVTEALQLLGGGKDSEAFAVRGLHPQRSAAGLQAPVAAMVAITAERLRAHSLSVQPLLKLRLPLPYPLLHVRQLPCISL